MSEYVLVFALLLAIAIAFYIGYDRLLGRKRKSESSLYVEALRDLLDGRQEAAFSKLRQVVNEDSTNLDAYVRLGRILRENNQADRALQVHRDLTLRPSLSNSERVAILREIATDCRHTGDNATAERALNELVSLDPNNYWGQAQLLRMFEDSSRWDEAFETAERVLRLEGTKSKKPLAKFKFEAAQSLYRKREYHKARVLYKEAIGLDNELVGAYLAIGDTYRDEDRFEDAVTFWTKLISAVPDKGHLVIDRLKKVLFDLGRFGDIQGICELILERDPRNMKARSALAEFYEKKGDLEQAAALWEQVVEDHPEDQRAALELVRTYLEKGNTARVQELLRLWERRREAKTGENVLSTNPTPAAGARS